VACFADAKPFFGLYDVIRKFSATHADTNKLLALGQQLLTATASLTSSSSSASSGSAGTASASAALHQALLQEQLFQQNALEHLNRLSSGFSEYPDIVQPFSVALQHVRHGLRLLAHTALCPVPPVAPASAFALPYVALRSLISFPFAYLSTERNPFCFALNPLQTLTGMTPVVYDMSLFFLFFSLLIRFSVFADSGVMRDLEMLTRQAHAVLRERAIATSGEYVTFLPFNTCPSFHSFFSFSPAIFSVLSVV
jgi:hypothetical protein